MKAQDLRIGNLLQNSFGKIHEVKEGNFRGIIIKSLDLEPIPLTEQLLIDFGFTSQIGFIKFIGEKFKDSSFEVGHNDLDKWYCYFRNFNKGEQDDFVLLRNDLKHVHQLQNLYNALTNKELTK